YLRDRSSEILETLRSWRLRARIMNLPEFIWELMIDSGYYLIMGTQPAGTQKQANLRALVEYADKFSDDKQSSLYGFVRYVDSLKKRDVKLSEVKMLGEADDVVKIMTIHKSKGLEFPMVIVAGMNGRLQYSNQEDLMIHKDIGVGLTLKSLEGHWKKTTLMQKLIGRKIRQKERDEEERILYVALTRARDILYLVGTVDKESAYESKSASKLKKAGSYLDMVAPYVDAKIVVPNVNHAEAEKKKSLSWKEAFDASDISEDERKSIEARLAYEYPHELATNLKSKYSVSEINKGGELEISSKATYNIGKLQNELKELSTGLEESPKTKGKVSAAKLGTIYHKIMEVIDFYLAKTEGYIYVEKIANECVEKHFFTAEELEQIDLNKICAFFDTEIGTRAAEASKRGELFKEKPFTLKMLYKGSDILVQGIIDCYFREPGKTVLIDYKSSYVSEIALAENEERIAEQYRKQVDIYADALSKSGESGFCEAYIYLLSSGHFIKMND
ncbi:MAG: PD-(D/E)XK nuclease family protein, partial [[Eubacterium] sulci]|nr:PD-(D/E)XK nuclease family protein [[Eubacterium] sulci]